MRRPAIAGIIALALLAGIVAGGEPPVESKAAAPRDAVAPQPAGSGELDVGKLVRTRAERTAPDLFANQSFAPPPPPPPAPVAVKPEPPPAPVAPPLPYSYLGRMQGAERTIVYLLKNQDMLMAERGETLENTYRVEDISDTAVQFVYLPLGTRQTLNVPPAP